MLRRLLLSDHGAECRMGRKGDQTIGRREERKSISTTPSHICASKQPVQFFSALQSYWSRLSVGLHSYDSRSNLIRQMLKNNWTGSKEAGTRPNTYLPSSRIALVSRPFCCRTTLIRLGCKKIGRAGIIIIFLKCPFAMEKG